MVYIRPHSGCVCVCVDVNFDKQVIPARKSDGKIVKLSEMNDYTNTKVKEETAMFEAKRTLETIPLCPGCLGGSMDNPKGIAKQTEQAAKKVLQRQP